MWRDYYKLFACSIVAFSFALLALSEDVDSSPNIDNIQEVSSENISKSSDELITDLNENNDKKDLEKVKIDTKSEGPVEMEWDVDSSSNEEEDLD